MSNIVNMSDLLKDEIELIKNYRTADAAAKASLAEYAVECAQGWPTYPDAGEYKPDPDDGLIHLHDCSFDFEDYFDRFRANELADGESDEFQARIYGMFCRDVFRSGGDMRRVSFWAANYIAERLRQALGGVPWEDIMGLPWDEPTPFLTKKGARALQIYADVENALKDTPGSNVTDLIFEAGRKHHISYPAARRDYYEYKSIVEKKKEFPSNFLNPDFGNEKE